MQGPVGPQHGFQPLAPLEVALVFLGILAQLLQVPRQVPSAGKVIDMDEGVRGQEVLVVFSRRPQHNRDGARGQGIIPELLGDVVFMLRVLESQVELVLGYSGKELVPGQGQVLLPIDVHSDVFLQLLVVLYPEGVCFPVADYPGHQLGLGRDAEGLGLAEELQLPIRGVDVRVSPVRHGQVEEVVHGP